MSNEPELFNCLSAHPSDEERRALQYFDKSYYGEAARIAYENYLRAQDDFDNGIISVEDRDAALAWSGSAGVAFEDSKKRNAGWLSDAITAIVILFGIR